MTFYCLIINSGLIYMKICPNQPRVWRMLGLKIMTAHEYVPLTNSHISPSLFPWMCCHWTIDHLLLFLQAHMSWWWVSSRPSPRSQSSVPWRWQTSPSSPRFTDGCGSWRWRSCSGCWPECRELPVETLHPLGSRTTCSCHACPAGLALFSWFLTNGRNSVAGLSSSSSSTISEGVRACDQEAWCKSDKDSDTRKQYLHCDVWRLNNTSYFPCGSCSYRSGAAGFTAGFIHVFMPSCLQCFASGQSLTHNENTSYPAKDIIWQTIVLKGPVHNKC